MTEQAISSRAAGAKSRQAKIVETLFIVHSKTANDVRITGDFTDWSPEGIPLREGKNGEWKTTLGLTPGEYQYRLILDGEWSDDPEALARVPNIYGGENCILQVKPSGR
jgi:1,4-alpha-glucan branching enzyme